MSMLIMHENVFYEPIFSLETIRKTFDIHMYVQCDKIRSEQLENENFYVPTHLVPHVQLSTEQIITFARHEYGRVKIE